MLDRTPFEKVTSILLETGMRYLLVVKDGALKGVIKKKDVLEVTFSPTLPSARARPFFFSFSRRHKQRGQSFSFWGSFGSGFVVHMHLF